MSPRKSNSKRILNEDIYGSGSGRALIMKMNFIENLESLSYSDEISETMMMGMRLNQGISLKKFEMQFGKTIKC